MPRAGAGGCLRRATLLPSLVVLRSGPPPRTTWSSTVGRCVCVWARVCPPSLPAAGRRGPPVPAVGTERPLSALSVAWASPLAFGGGSRRARAGVRVGVAAVLARARARSRLTPSLVGARREEGGRALSRPPLPPRPAASGLVRPLSARSPSVRSRDAIGARTAARACGRGAVPPHSPPPRGASPPGGSWFPGPGGRWPRADGRGDGGTPRGVWMVVRR